MILTVCLSMSQKRDRDQCEYQNCIFCIVKKNEYQRFYTICVYLLSGMYTFHHYTSFVSTYNQNGNKKLVLIMCLTREIKSPKSII